MRYLLTAAALFCFVLSAAGCGDEASNSKGQDAKPRTDGVIEFEVGQLDYTEDCIGTGFLISQGPEHWSDDETIKIDGDSIDIDMSELTVCPHPDCGIIFDNVSGPQEFSSQVFEESPYSVEVFFNGSPEYNFEMRELRLVSSGKLVTDKFEKYAGIGDYSKTKATIKFPKRIDYSKPLKVEVLGTGASPFTFRVNKELKYIKKECL